MFCGECGHRWEADEIATARFCAECGAPREDPPPPSIPTATSSLPSSTNTQTSFHNDLFTSSIVGTDPISRQSSGMSNNSTYSAAQPTISMPSSGPTVQSVQSIQITTPMNSSVCTSCSAPFSDNSSLFCGECGTPRQNLNQNTTSSYSGQNNITQTATSSYSTQNSTSQEYDGGLFGAASTPLSISDLQSSQYAQSHSASWGNQSSGITQANSMVENPSFSMHSAHPPTTDGEIPASLTLNASDKRNSTITSLLSKLTVSSTHERRHSIPEADGHGTGISISRVWKTRNMNPLATRQLLSNAIDRNIQSPEQIVEGYKVTHVNDTVTICQKEDLVCTEDKFFDKNSVVDNSDWQNILRHHRRNGSQFVDTSFPADSRSIYRDVNNKTQYPQLEEHVWKWKRLSEFFHETAFVEITMIDDDRQLICSIAMKSAAEADAIIQTVNSMSSTLPSSFIEKAKQAVSSGLSRQKREHLLLCTKNMISYMSEYVENGIQRFDLLWEKSILEQYKPLQYSGVGECKGYRIDGGKIVVNRVAVLVPVLFQAQGTCIFDRSLELVNPNEASVSGVGIQPADVRVGRLPDSYLFGAMAMLTTAPKALAQLFPDLDTDLIQKMEGSYEVTSEQQFNKEGVYAVRFWKNHRSRVVIIDDFVPCSKYGKPVFGSFTGNNGKFEIWSLLVEKAYAKLHGSYEAIIGGQEVYALQDLYGGVPHTFGLQTEYPTLDAAWHELTRSLDAGNLIGFCNETSNVADLLPLGIKPSHVYGLMKLVELNYQGQMVRLAQVRNSWGTGSTQMPEKWTGEWSSSDPRWHSFSRSQKVECGFQFREDQTYWMDFTQFYQIFTQVFESKNLYNFPSYPDNIQNPINPSLSVHIVRGKWSGITSGGRVNMHLNPQVQIFSPVPRGNFVTLMLEQTSRRVLGNSDYSSYVATCVFKNGQPRVRKINLSQDSLMTGTFISSRGSSLFNIPLDQDSTDESNRPFLIIPATYDPLPSGQSLDFSLALFTTKPTAVVPISDTTSLPLCCVCKQALSGAFRTFTLTGDTSNSEQVDRVCEGCVHAYRQQNTSICADCHERIEPIPGKFSGRMFTLPDGTSVHAECIDAYRIRTSEKCIHCGQAIAMIPGRFDGKYFDLPQGAGKVHGECMESYQRQIAPKCAERSCGLPIMTIPGKFNGQFYKLDHGEQVHFECWDKYQESNAPKCAYCYQAIVVVPGKFDGRFYDLTNEPGKKVHFECWDAYQFALQAKR